MKWFVSFLLSSFVVEAQVELPLEKKYIEYRYKKRDSSKKIKIFCIFQNFGFDSIQDSIENLPKKVTLALSPYVLWDKEKLMLIKEYSLLWIQPMEFYRQGIDHEDPLRITRLRNKDENKNAFLRSMDQMPKQIIGLISEETSPVLRDKGALTPFLKELKERKLPFISPESSINHEFLSFCKAEGVQCLEADYAIQITDNLEKVLDIFKRVQDLGEKTGYAVIVIDFQKILVQTFLDWINKLPKENFELASIKEFLNGL